MIAMVYEEPHVPRFFGEDDLPWIGRLVDIVEQTVGEPWRVLVSRVERAELGVHSSHRAAMLQALRRVLGGDGARAAAGAGDALLWIDLAMQRPVALPDGRPHEVELAAFANLARIQRCVRRAHEVRLRVWGDADALARYAAGRGAITEVRVEGDATQLDLVGPLALFHSTRVYGRALADVMVRLADHPRFELDVRCWLYGDETDVRIAPPILLPRVRASPLPPGDAERLGCDLADHGYDVEREPPPLASGAYRLFPELAIEHAGARWFLELHRFSTPRSLANRLACYRAAGARAILCVDLETSPGCDLRPQICGYRGEVDLHDLRATLELRR